MQFGFVFLLTIGLLFSQSLANKDCDNSDAPFLCHSTRVVRSIFEHVLNSDKNDTTTSLNLVPGIDIVEVTRNNSELNDVDVNRTMDNSYLGRVSRYLERHELKIKFPQIVRSDDDNDILNDSVQGDNGNDITGIHLKIFKSHFNLQ